MKTTPRLIIGNCNYSTWSLRAWMCLKAFGCAFDTERVSLAQPGLRDRLLNYSPAARVPVLIDGDLTIWDSLAIAEYAADSWLQGVIWPLSPEARATARSLVAEMHSGFAALRNELPMNLRARRQVELSTAARRDLDRIEEIWSQAPQVRGEHDGFLFGRFGLVDAFFAPVALRLPTYGITLDKEAESYAVRLRRHHCLREWFEMASQESEVLEEDETGQAVPGDGEGIVQLLQEVEPDEPVSGAGHAAT